MAIVPTQSTAQPTTPNSTEEMSKDKIAADMLAELRYTCVVGIVAVVGVLLAAGATALSWYAN